MPVSVSRMVKEFAYANPASTPQAILDQVTAAGGVTTLASVSTIRSDFLNSIRLLEELGAFKAAAPVALAKKGKKGKAPSRATRWAEACAKASAGIDELLDLQSEYSDWRDNLPESLGSSPVGEKLEAVCDIDLESAKSAIEEAEGADLPLGFGRD